MSIKKLPNGCYQVSYSKRHPITKLSVNNSLRTIEKNGKKEPIKTKAEAIRVHAKLICYIHNKIREKIVPLWPNLVNEFVVYFKQQNVSVKTVDSYFLCLRAHTFKDWESRFSDTITSNEIRELIEKNVGHRSESHKKNVLKYIRAVFSYATEKGILDRNPTPLLKFKIGDKHKTSLTEEQAGVLLTQSKLVESEWYPVWAFALYTGLRNGELYALTWDKVNINQKVILVDSSWNSKDGFKDTKSGDDRIVEIAQPLLFILKELKIQNADSPFVLPRIDKWDKGEQARELRRFLEGLGLPRIRFHDLRASWATIMLTKGIPPIKVMSMGGWKDLKTMQFYIRKAGVDIKGITKDYVLHDPTNSTCRLLNFDNS